MTPRKPGAVKQKLPKHAARAMPHKGPLEVAEAVHAALESIEPPIPEIQNQTKEYLRLLAMMHYTTDFNQCTVDTMAQHPLFASVTKAQLEKWCSIDRWVAQREMIQLRWRDQVALHMGERMVQERIAAVRDVQQVKTKLLDRLVITHQFTPYVDPEDVADEEDPTADNGKKRKKLPPRPSKICGVCGRPRIGHDDPFWGVKGDALVNAFAKLVELEFQLSEVVLHGIGGGEVSAVGKADGADAATQTLAAQGLSREEALAAAHAIIRTRRDLALGTAPAATDVDPDLPDGGA